MPRPAARIPPPASARTPLPDGAGRPTGLRRTASVRWRLLLWRVRFPVAATFLGIAAALAAQEVSPEPAPTVAVAVAARRLAPGGALTAADLRIVRMPTALVPSGAHARTEDVVGRSLVLAAPPGLPIVDALLAGDRLATAGPAGTVVAPVRLADPAVAALLRPGDRIDLLAAAGTADGEPVARQLAERALVLADPGPAPSDARGAGSGPAAGLLGAGSDLTAGALTLVAVTPTEAAALAGAVGWASLSAVVVE